MDRCLQWEERRLTMEAAVDAERLARAADLKTTRYRTFICYSILIA